MSDRPAALAWSSAQLVRLESEWRRLRRAFAFHPHVEIIPLSGDPPTEYQVQYKVTTLAVDASGELAYVDAMPVHLWLPPHFPHEAPVIRPMGPAFHPNVNLEWVHLNPAWRPDRTTLVEVVTQVGELLAYRAYDADAVLNGVAMNWVYANAALLPTDPAADFSPGAGGEPLARIVRAGAAAVEEQRRKVEATCDRLVSAEPPGEAEVREFTGRVRLALSVFEDADLPQALRAAAAEVEETVLSMQGPDLVWAQVARQISTAEAAAAAVERVAAAETALAGALEEFDAFDLAGASGVGTPAGAEAAGPLRNVPALAAVQPMALELRRAVREADEAVGELRARLGQLAPAPRTVGFLPGRMLTRRLAREAARAAAAAGPARASGAVVASAELVLGRARRESAAVDRVTAWAEYADLMRRGEELIRRLTGSDPASLNAFFASTPPGESIGDSLPHEYEQPVTLAGTALAVANPRGSFLRVYDLESEEVIAAGDGIVTLPTPAGAGANARPLVLRAGERTDELRVQIEYLLTQTGELLARLMPHDNEPTEQDEPPSDSWAGHLAASLDAEEVRRPVVEEHRRASRRWKGLLSELAALGRFKQRLGAYYKFSRLIHFVPRAQAREEAARQLLARADARLAEIAARAAHDLETNQLVVPQHLAAEYADWLAERDRAQQEILRVNKSLQGVAERVRGRLSKAKLPGSAEVPALRILAPVPESLRAPGAVMTGAALDVQVARLEELLGVKLRATPDRSMEHPAAQSDRI